MCHCFEFWPVDVDGAAVFFIQLQDLQDELRRKESRWNANTARLKNRLAELEHENGELKEEVRILEKKRLEWMTAHSSQKNSVQSSGAGENGTGKSGSNSRQVCFVRVGQDYYCLFG